MVAMAEDEAIAMGEVRCIGGGTDFNSSAEFTSWPLDDCSSCRHYYAGTAMSLTVLRYENQSLFLQSTKNKISQDTRRFARRSVKHQTL